MGRTLAWLGTTLAIALPRIVHAEEPIAARDAHGWWQNATTTLFEPAGDLGSFPVAAAIDVVGDDGRTHKRVFAGVAQNPDDPAAALEAAFLVSEDGGISFVESGADEAPEVTNLALLPDGTLLDVSFKATAFLGATLELLVRRSTDGGATWQPETATLTTDAQIGGFRLHRGILVLADGTLLSPAYLAYAGESSHGVRLLESTDRGASWSVRATIVAPTASTGYNETAIAQTSDGSLLAVIRTATDSGHGALVQSRSLDLGATWSPVTEVLVPFGGDPTPRLGVDPALLLMPNGVLVLTGGRPDNWLAISGDGTGNTWAPARITYVNRPSQPPNASQYHGSSGYSAIVDVASNRLLLVGDNCANSWGCPASEGGWTVDGEPRIWQAFVDVLTPDVGKIDLRGGIEAGRIELGGNMTWTDPLHPEAGATAAFDGSTAPWSAAFAEGDDEPPTLVLRLDRIHELTRIGLCLRRGLPASAEVFVSEDGATWGEPVLALDQRTHHAIEYVDLPAPVRAGWVRVVGVAEACNEPFAAACGVLGELELYSTIDSFENDGIGAVPRGYTEAALSRTTSIDGARALRIADTSADVHAKLVHRGDASPTKRLEFRMRPDALPNAFLFDVLGTDAAGDEVTAYHLAWTGDGTLRHYDVATQTWTDVAGPGLVAPGAWSTIRVLADTQGATVCVDGEPIATVDPSTAGIASLVGHGFASAGTASTGDDVLVDDVLFDDAQGDCAIELPGDPPADDTGTDDGSSGGASMGDEGTSTVDPGIDTGGLESSGGSAGADTDAQGCGCSSEGARPRHAMLLLSALSLFARRRRHG